jgi:hypothetical protein
MGAIIKWMLTFFIVLYGVVGFVVVPHLIEKEAPKIVHEQTQGYLSLGKVSFNPFNFGLEIDDLYFTPPDHSRFTQFKKLSINFELYSLLMGKIHFKSIVLLKPDVNLVYSKKEQFNFEWLRHLESAPSEPKSEPTALPPLKIDLLSIKEGVIRYGDFTKAKPFEVVMTPIDFDLKEIDTSKHNNTKDSIRLLAHLEDGGFLDLRSDIVSTEPFALEGTLDFESGKLFTGWSYMQEQLNLEVADGKLTAHAHYSVDSGNLDAMRIDELRFALNRLRVIPKEGHHDILNIKELALTDGFVEPMRQHVELKSVHIDDVSVTANRNKKGKIDWQHYAAIIKKENQKKSEKERDNNATATPPWNVLLHHFALNNLHVKFNDKAVSPATTTTLTRLDLKADHLSSKANTPLNYALTMKINERMECQGSGALRHSKLHVDGDFGCKGVDITWANPYIDQASRSALKKYDLYVASGVSDFGVNYKVDENKSINVQLNQTHLNLSRFALKQKRTKAKVFSIKNVSITDIGVDTQKEEAAIGALSIVSPYVYAALNRDGALNWSRYIVAKKTKSKKSASKKKGSTWHTTLNTFKLKNGALRFNNYTLGKKPVTTKLGAIYVTAKGIDSKKRTSLKYRASLRLNRKGKITARGRLQHTPLYHKGSLNVDTVQLNDFNAYVNQDHYIDLKRGELSLKSSIIYAPSKKKADLHVDGNVDIRDFVLENALDESVLLAWNRIEVAPFLFEHNPNKLFVKEVLVDGFYANAIIDQNRTMNFAKLSKHPVTVDENSTQSDSNETKEPFPMQIVKVQLSQSSANFADYSLPLKFEAYIHDFGGNIYGISSNKNEKTQLELNGVVNKYGSAKLKGAFNAAAVEEYTDINLVFRNINLVNMSPYSGKFIGQKISNGKLFLDLNYDIVKSQMKGENSIIVKKLELGEEVESPDAVDVPLGLAIALLEDSDGVIDLELPVSGDMNNPEFSYGHIVFQAFFNLLTKAVTAPFSLLGSMLGIDGDALEYVEFEPSSSSLLPPEKEKLDKLSKALIKRPKLQLELHGSYNKLRDTTALQHVKLLNIAVAKAKKEGELFKGDARLELLEDLYEEIIGDDKLDALQEHLEKAFKDDERGYAKAYDAKMIEDLSHAQTVTPEELVALAQQRATMIKEYLIQEKSIQADRIILGEIAVATQDEEKWVKTTMELVVK